MSVDPIPPALLEPDVHEEEGDSVIAFSREELTRAFVQPQLVIEYILGEYPRLSMNLAQGGHLGLVVLLLGLTSTLVTIPYAMAAPDSSFWHVAVLYTGSMLICFPSLHIFSCFLGNRFRLSQNLALGLVITSVASLFTFGFFPIIWFMEASIRAAPGSAITPASISTLLLWTALALGVVHMVRCLALRKASIGGNFNVFLVVWLALLVFITQRMTRVLDML